jgi:hypothetical protein
MRASITEGRMREIGALEVGWPGGQRASVMKTIQTADHHGGVLIMIVAARKHDAICPRC